MAIPTISHADNSALSRVVELVGVLLPAPASSPCCAALNLSTVEDGDSCRRVQSAHLRDKPTKRGRGPRSACRPWKPAGAGARGLGRRWLKRKAVFRAVRGWRFTASRGRAS
jgi:hypothetical protein